MYDVLPNLAQPGGETWRGEKKSYGHTRENIPRFLNYYSLLARSPRIDYILSWSDLCPATSTSLCPFPNLTGSGRRLLGPSIMAYNAITQIDEVASHSGSDASRSPSPPHHSFHQKRDADHLGGGSYLETARTEDKPSLAQLSSVINSMSATTSYDLVEADDYDEDPSPKSRSSSPRHSIPPLNTDIPDTRHSSPEPPLHSASSDLPVPLNHPTPDLQSLQGAYLGNVERLEQSAERMSSSSADIGSEIRKMDLEQKRRSCSSASNSVIMRNGAFSSGSIASPLGSTISTRQRSVSGGSRLAQLAEPDHEEDAHFLDRFPVPLPILAAPEIPVYTQSNEIYYDQHDQYGGQYGDAGEIERPPSAASGDTFQQARTLFTDFDGVHFTPLELPNAARRVSLNQPPLASKPESYKEPQSGEHMVYYPAPVPRTLNLPPKLSRKPIVDREKRRTQILTSIAAEDTKLASAQNETAQQNASGASKAKRLSKAPPQLRASVFFDRPSTTLEVEVKQDSAVATLDSILDASATAPVSAFTDHPYAGHVGSYVYGKSKRKTLSKDPKRQTGRHSQFLMGQRHSTAVGDEGERLVASDDERRKDHLDESRHRNDSAQSDDSESEGDSTSPGSDDEESEDEEGEEQMDYVGPPNTLLAELQLRKHELKQRRRTALPMPSDGMQTTLLEMDAMAQKKSEKRRQRPVTLAWDNRDTADDDDVPLAMLYPDKANAQDESRPIGLMERRQLEENEPLSSRRARLRGEPIPEKHPVTVHVVQPSEPEPESGDEGETLAERLRRLKGQNPEESDFAHELLAEFDSRSGIAPKETEVALEEETLAQRRSRLQKENLTQNGNARNPRMPKSMAALPENRSAHVSHKMSHDVLQQPTMMQQYGHRMSMQSLPVNMLGHNAGAGYPMQQPYGYGMAYPHTQSSYGPYGLNMSAGCGPTMARQQPIDPTQRDVIDRWRQSIR